MWGLQSYIHGILYTRNYAERAVGMLKKGLEVDKLLLGGVF